MWDELHRGRDYLLVSDVGKSGDSAEYSDAGGELATASRTSNGDGEMQYLNLLGDHSSKRRHAASVS